MSMHTTSFGKVLRIVRQYGSAMLSGATGALCFSLIAMSVSPTLSTALRTPSRTMIAQEWRGVADPDQDWNSVGEADRREEDERQYTDLGRQIQDNRHQLKSMKGDLKRLKKELKGHADLVKLEAYVKEFETELNSVDDAYKTIAANDRDAMQDLQSDLPSSSDFYDLLQDLNEQVNFVQQAKDAQRNIKDKGKITKDMERECKRVKCAGSELEGMIKQFKALVDTMKSAVAAKNLDAFADASGDADERQQEFWSALEEYNRKSDLGRTIKERAKNTKEMERECKRVKCAGSELEGMIKQFKVLVDTMRSAVAKNDFDEFDNANGDAGTLQQAFWPALEEHNRKLDLGRNIKDLEKNLKDINRMEKDVDQRAATENIAAATLSAIKDVISILRSAAQDARTAYNAGDYEKAQDALDRTHDAFTDLDQLRNAIENNRNDSEDLEDILRDISNGEKDISDALANGTTSKETASLCRGLLSQGRAIIIKYKATPSDALMEQLGSIGDKVNASCGQLMND